MQIATRTVNSTGEYLEAIFATSKKCKDAYPDSELWFRGHFSNSWQLLPGAYRHTIWDEGSIFGRFCNDLPMVVDAPSRPNTVWESYFAAQHYGLPTRLLDWTEDALVALHFAVRASHSDADSLQTKWSQSAPPCVWILEAGSLSHALYGEDVVYLPGEDETGKWLPWTCVHGAPESWEAKGKKISNEYPLPIHPARATRRIGAQSGKFTVHGTSNVPIEEMWVKDGLMHATRCDHLVRVDIIDPGRVSQELFDIGMTKVRLFPEPAYLADHLRRLYAP